MRSGTRPPGRADADAAADAGRDGPEGAAAPDTTAATAAIAAPARPRRGDRGLAPGPGADGTLLAVVPIPGTGTSLAIVGYPVAMPGEGAATGPAPAVTAAAVQAAAIPALSAVAAGTGPDGGDPGAAGLVLDRGQRRVWADGREITLTFQEFELLSFLTAHPATVFTRADLVRQAWQRDFGDDSRTVDVHVSRLRHKLGRHGRSLVTEYRVGYQYRPFTRPA